MARLIDADALKDEILSWAVCIKKPHLLNREDTMFMIDNAPTVDAVEVVHGRWEKRKLIVFDDEMVGYRCSKCNTTWDAETNYCPNCGAKMDGGDEDG